MVIFKVSVYAILEEGADFLPQGVLLDECPGELRGGSRDGDIHGERAGREHAGSVRTQAGLRLTTAGSYYTLKAREGSSGRHHPCAVFLDKIAGKTTTPYRRNPNDNAHGREGLPRSACVTGHRRNRR